ncbi:hypothetical protein OAO87_00550 [bacterium]|nr:hypothetical protein [bacterium]
MICVLLRAYHVCAAARFTGILVDSAAVAFHVCAAARFTGILVLVGSAAVSPLHPHPRRRLALLPRA